MLCAADGVKNTEGATVYFSVTATDSSDVYCAHSGGHHSKTFALEANGSVLGLFWYGAKSQLVSVSESGDLCIHEEKETGNEWQLVVKLRIGGGAVLNGPALLVAWVGQHTLASASGRDNVVRMYDLDTEDNYILRLGVPPNQNFFAVLCSGHRPLADNQMTRNLAFCCHTTSSRASTRADML